MKTFYEWLTESADPSAFAQAIMAAPDEAVNYLVFADWLEDSGNYYPAAALAASAFREIGDGLRNGGTKLDRLVFLGLPAQRAALLAMSGVCARHAGLGAAIAPATPDDLNQLLDGYSSHVGQYSLMDIQVVDGVFRVNGEVEVDLSNHGPGASAQWIFSADIDPDELEIVDFELDIPDDDPWAPWVNPDEDDIIAVDPDGARMDLSRDLQGRLNRYAIPRNILIHAAAHA